MRFCGPLQKKALKKEGQLTPTKDGHLKRAPLFLRAAPLFRLPSGTLCTVSCDILWHLPLVTAEAPASSCVR